jgi:Na+/H+ antiporter NhaA
MCFFFFGVGLEIKKEVIAGSLSSTQTASLPCIAALGKISGKVNVLVQFCEFTV